MYSFFVLYSLGPLRTAKNRKCAKWSTEATLHSQVWRKILQVHGLPQLAQTRRIPWTPASARTSVAMGQCKFSNLNSWKTFLGPNPQNGITRKFPAMTPPFPRDSRPAACHATACAPLSCHEARPPWAGFRDGDLPPPFPGGVGFWHPPVFQGSQLRWRNVLFFYQKKRRFKTSDTMNGRGNQIATRNIKYVESLQFNRFQQHCYTDDLTNLSPIIFRKGFSKFIHLLKWLDLVIPPQRNQPTTWGFW